MNTITINLESPWTVKNGKAVCPVTMIKQGVLAGSKGPIFWPAHILEKNAHKWENVPVVLNHPEVDGEQVSINHNEETKAQIIGKVINPRFEDQAIKAEVEVPYNHPDIALIQSLKEVSIGVFSTETQTYGEHSGKEYMMSAITMEPDHLALLTDAVGACNFVEGCGLRTHELQTLQRAAEKEEILLPTEFNVNLDVEENDNTKSGTEEPLLPNQY